MGRLAKQYGMLPSEVLAKATTFDLMVTDVLATYEIYEHYKSQGQNVPVSEGDFEEDELKRIMEKARSE